jgi:hypothetical protein
MIRFNPSSLESGISGSRGAVRKKQSLGCGGKYLVNCFMVSVILLYMVVVIQSTLMYMENKPETSEPSHLRGLHQNVHFPTSESISFLAVKDDPKYTITDAQVLSFSFDDLHGHLNCYEHAISQNKQLYTSDMWQHMVQKYAEVTGDKITLEPQPQSTFYVGKSEGAGRGVFASRDIAKGEIIPFEATTAIVTFDDGVLWKKFVVSLPHAMACDVMEWSWTQDVFAEGNMKLCLSIGDGDSFLNSRGAGTLNIAPTNMTSRKFWAVNDIKEGEELAFDYDVFPTRFDLFGLRSS